VAAVLGIQQRSNTLKNVLNKVSCQTKLVFLLPIIALKLIGLDFVGAVLVDIETRHIKSWTALASYLGPKSCCYESELTNISTLPA
jgi:hypothetical protein